MDLSDKLKAANRISLDCKMAEVLGIACSKDGCTQCLETIMRMEKVIERLYCDLCYQAHPECTQPLCEKSENYANLVMRKK